MVVYDRPSGLTPADRARALRDRAGYARVPGVRQRVAGPFFAADGKAIEISVPVNLGSKGWNGAEAAVSRLRAIALSSAGSLSVHITGPLGSAADSAKFFSEILTLLADRGLHRAPSIHDLMIAGWFGSAGSGYGKPHCPIL